MYGLNIIMIMHNIIDFFKHFNKISLIIMRLVVITTICLLFYPNVLYSIDIDSLSSEMNKYEPLYIYYCSLNEEDIYKDICNNLFIFKNNERKIIYKSNEGREHSLSDLSTNVLKDKYGNLYIIDDLYHTSRILVKIDEKFNAVVISNDPFWFKLINGEMFYYEEPFIRYSKTKIYIDKKGKLSKIIGNEQIEIFSDAYYYEIHKIGENDFYFCSMVYGIDTEGNKYNYKDLLFVNGNITKVDKKDREKYLQNKYNDNENDVITVNISFDEKIENYKQTNISVSKE